MPASIVKTPEDEKAWERAKKAADKYHSRDEGEVYWKYVMSIFKQMTHREDTMAMDPVLQEFFRLSGVLQEIAVAQMTAPQIAKAIYDGLPEYHALTFRAEQGAKLGAQDSVMVTCASVPKGAAEIDAWNSEAHCMIHILAAPKMRWPLDGSAPELLTATQFQGRGVKMRAKTASPDKIIAYVIDFFKKNAKAFGAK